MSGKSQVFGGQITGLVDKRKILSHKIINREVK